MATRRAGPSHNGTSANGAGPRIGVRKTYKLYIGGAFPRSESGRSYPVSAAADGSLANAVRSSRKDETRCVRRTRVPGWSGKTAMNRGQVLYRVAELMEGRRDQFVAEVAAAEGCATAGRRRWSIARSTAGSGTPAGRTRSPRSSKSANPVAAPYFNFTIPEPTGIVGIVAPEASALLGLVSRLAPPLVAGNTVVLLTSETRPLPAITLTEVLATSDVPGGVVNVLTGFKELVPVLAGHVDVDGLDVWGVPDDLRVETEQLAADDIKRLSRRPRGVADACFDWLDDRATERPEWIAAFLEMKTVWHPIGV